MNIQKISFGYRQRTINTRKNDNKNHNIQTQQHSSKLSKTLIMLGVLATAGIGIGYVAYRKGKKAGEIAQKLANTAAGAALGAAAFEVSKDTIQKISKKEEEPLISTDYVIVETPEINPIQPLTRTQDKTDDENIIYIEPQESFEQPVKEKTSDEPQDILYEETSIPDSDPEEALFEEWTESPLNSKKDSQHSEFQLSVEKTEEQKNNENGNMFNLGEVLEKKAKKESEPNDSSETSDDDTYARIAKVINSKSSTEYERIRKERQEKYDRAMDEYYGRAGDRLKISDRIKIIEEERELSKYGYRPFIPRKVQLGLLPNKTLNALDDDTLAHLLYGPRRNGLLGNLGFLKSLSPEKIVRIQTNERRNALYEILECDPSGYSLDCLRTYLIDS